jgi:6-phosphofructokinase 1
MTEIKKIGVLTSGGDAPGMNAAIRAVVRAGLYHKFEVIGIRKGYQGMIDGDYASFDSNAVSGIIQYGGTILQTARCNEFLTFEGRKKAYGQLQKEGIDAVVAIGGDGTFTGANIMAEEFGYTFIGIPGTIDNDLFGTDYTIGFSTALTTVVEAVDKIRDTAKSHGRIFFVEVMGREAGFLALLGGIACGAEGILIPEEKGDIEVLRKYLKERARRKKSSIILVAEGEEAGGAIQIAKIMKTEFPDFDIRTTILGHVQRGGSPSPDDRIIASRMGKAAIESLVAGERNIMIGIVNNNITKIPLQKAVKEHKKIDEGLLEIFDVLGG